MTGNAEPRPASLLAFILNLMASLALMALMIITCIDVIGRYVFNKPLTGGTELIELGLAVSIFTVLPVISWRNEHIVVDMLDSYFSPLLHFLKNSLINLVSAMALFFLGQRLQVLGNRSLEYEETTEFLLIPLGWGINFMGYMCWLTMLTLVTLGIYNAYKTYQGATQA